MVAALRQVIDMGPTLGRDGRVVTRISVPSPELRKGLSASPYDGSMTDSLQQLRALVHEHELRAVVSDLDGVLRVFDPALWSELDAIAGVPDGAAFTAVLGHPFLDEVVRGRGTHQQWRERSAAALVEAGGTPQSAASALRTWLASPARVDRGLLAELEALRSEGLGVFVLTNGTDRVPEELEELGLTAFLGDGGRFLLNTADLGAAKPDHEAFVRAHARIEQELCASVRPDEIAFLDDSARHVRGAARFGWHAVHHRPARDRFRRSDPDPSEGGAGLP